MICGAALAAGGTAFAQTAPAPAATTVGEIVVTGSRIPTVNLTSASPVTIVGSQEAKLEGVTRTEDLLNQLPQVFAGQSSTVSNGATGIATVDLRGLGPARTLVLIDGRRLAPGDPVVPESDLNFIPDAMIDHVEVLTGGASAVYGSDAVAGVVNFITLKNFEGLRLDASVGGYQHSNNNSLVQGLATAHGFPYQAGSVWGGRQTEFTAVIGVNSPDGKGNATAYAGYRSIQPLLQSTRDYSACTLGEKGSSFACSGSGTTSPVDIISNDIGAVASSYRFIVDKGGPGNTLRPYNGATDAFNYGPYNYYQRPDERYIAGATAHYEVNEHFDAYTQLMFMDDHTVAQIAPSGIFGQTFNIPCTSPLFSAQEAATLCGNPVAPVSTASLAILRRNVEGGGRQDDLRHTDYRLVLGAKGDINSDWSYDAYGQIGRTVYQEEYLNDMSLSRLGNALNVDTAPDGSLQCADAAARAQGCVPYNIFKIGGVTPAALNYLETPGFKDGSVTETVLSASVTGKFPWAKSPYASDAPGVAFGTEYRRENLDLRVDSAFDTGDLSGQGGPTHGVNGAYQVYELYGELNIPLVQDMPYVKSLSLDTGYRFSDYSTAGTTNTYKFAGNWSVNDDFALRASFERAVRAPNIVELFTPSTVGLTVDADPCAGSSPTDTAAQCANTGVSAAQYGHVAINSAAQYNGLTGGNTSLKPETADTYSVGGVFTPTMVPGFSLTIDYYNIKVDNYIQALDPNLVLSTCAEQGTAALCALVHRAPGTGSLWLGTTGYVTGTNVNVGYLKTSGIDFEANYRMPLSRVGWSDGGSLAFNFVGTYLMDLSTNPGIPKVDSSGNTVIDYNCAGLYGLSTCGTPNPTWRHRFRATWNTPWHGLQLSAAWRYIASVDFEHTSTNPYLTGTVYPGDAKLPAESYFDLSAQVKLRDSWTMHFGVQNVLDKDPPLVGSNAGGTDVRFNGNTYPPVYDSLGRYLFVGVTADF